MNPTQNQFINIARAARRALISPILLTASLAVAQDRKPADAPPQAAREAAPGAPRGERQPGDPTRGRSRDDWPAEIKLTDEQQARWKEISADLDAKLAELGTRRASLLTDEQKAAQAAASQKLREGNLTRQEAADLVATALKLTPEQKTQIEAIDLGARKLAQDAFAQKTAVLTEEQRTTLRKLTVANSLARVFTIPGGIAVSEEQKAGLQALQIELGGRLADLTESQSIILTDERRTAREAAYKEARESGKDREATAAAVDAALKLTDAEKTQLAETEQSLRELHEKIRDRMMALLTPEQKAELEKKFGVGRSRN